MGCCRCRRRPRRAAVCSVAHGGREKKGPKTSPVPLSYSLSMGGGSLTLLPSHRQAERGIMQLRPLR
jgi:hypothetical protein